MIVSMLSRRPPPAAEAPPPPPPQAPPPDDAPPPGLLDRRTRAAPPTRPATRLDFAGRDPLGLASDPGVLTEAARLAAEAIAAHGAGAAAALGDRLAVALAGLVGLGHAVVLPGPESAAEAVIRALVGPGDHVLLDNFARPALQRAADAAGADAHRYPHASLASVGRWLEAIRTNSPQAGVLIVTDSLAPRGGDAPDLGELQVLARRHGATLLVDLDADLGAMGDGGGAPDLQGMRGAVDVVTGSLAALGGGPGGFAASSHPGLAAALGALDAPDARPLPPLQAALGLAAVALVVGPEGARRRDRLVVASRALALGLRAAGFEASGGATPVVHAAMRRDEGRRAADRARAVGAAVELVEGPGGDRAPCRIRIRVAADHDRRAVEALVACLAEGRDAPRAEADAGGEEGDGDAESDAGAPGQASNRLLRPKAQDAAAPAVP